MFTPVASIQYKKAFNEAIVPHRMTQDSVGYDLFTPIDLNIEAGSQTIVDTGIILYMHTSINHVSYYAQICSKSSVATRKKTIVDTGVIDPGFRGTIRVVLRNIGTETVSFIKGDPVAQIVFIPVHLPLLQPLIFANDKTERGNRGFGGILC